MDTHICKKCETTFALGRTKSRYQKTVYAITMVIIGIPAALSVISLNFYGIALYVGLMFVRRWFYLRAIGSNCPACKSMDCISLDTPMGKRLSGK
jgi:uncharacterized paraquat-inducible protein A